MGGSGNPGYLPGRYSGVPLSTVWESTRLSAHHFPLSKIFTLEQLKTKKRNRLEIVVNNILFVMIVLFSMKLQRIGRLRERKLPASPPVNQVKLTKLDVNILCFGGSEEGSDSFSFFCLGMKGGGGLPLRIPAADETSAAVQAAMHYADLLCTVMCFNTRSSGNKSGHFTPKPHTRFNFTWLKINLF